MTTHPNVGSETGRIQSWLMLDLLRLAHWLSVFVEGPGMAPTVFLTSWLNDEPRGGLMKWKCQNCLSVLERKAFKGVGRSGCQNGVTTWDQLTHLGCLLAHQDPVETLYLILSRKANNQLDSLSRPRCCLTHRYCFVTFPRTFEYIVTTQKNREDGFSSYFSELRQVEKFT